MMIPKNMLKVPRALQTMSQEEYEAFRRGYILGYNTCLKRLDRNKLKKKE